LSLHAGVQNATLHYICAGSIDEYGVPIQDEAAYDPQDAFSKIGLSKVKASFDGEGKDGKIGSIFKYFLLSKDALDSVFNEMVYLLKNRQGRGTEPDQWFQNLLNRHSDKVVWQMKLDGFPVEKEVEVEGNSGTDSEVVEEDGEGDGGEDALDA
jgi:hypothetical protein